MITTDAITTKNNQQEVLTEREVLTHAEAAEYLRMSERALYRAVDKGEVPSVKIGGKRKYRLTVLRWLLEGRA